MIWCSQAWCVEERRAGELLDQFQAATYHRKEQYNVESEGAAAGAEETEPHEMIPTPWMNWQGESGNTVCGFKYRCDWSYCENYSSTWGL